MFTSMHSMHVSKIISQIRAYIKPCCALSQLFVPLQVLTLRTSLYTYIYSQVLVYIYCRRKFRSQTSDSMDRWKAEMGRVREETRRRKRKSQKKEIQVREKVGKSRNMVFFQWFEAPDGRKVGSLKRGVRSQLARNEKLHAVVVRSKFRNQKLKNTPAPDHFWKLRCQKNARCCGAKHISKSKCTKHTMYGPLLEVEMSKKCTPLLPEAHFQAKIYKTHHARTTFGSWCLKSAHRFGAKHISKSKCTKHTMDGPLLEVEMSKKCTPFWREAHFQVKMYKTHHCRTTFGSWDVKKVHAVVARSTFSSQNVQNTRGADHFWQLRCRKSARHCGAKHISKSKCTKHTLCSDHFWKLMSKNCTPLWCEANFEVKS